MLIYDNYDNQSKLRLCPVSKHTRNTTDQFGRLLYFLVQLTLTRTVQIVLNYINITLYGCPRASSDLMYLSGIAKESSSADTIGRNLG